MKAMTDFLSIRDFTSTQIQRLIDLALEMKHDPGAYSQRLAGKTLALILEKPSLRTRVTFDVGVQQLGGFSVYLSPAEIKLGQRESLYDVARNLERMVQGIMIRTFAHENVEKMAEYCSVPVINGLTDYSHPCQAMADFMTIYEAKGKTDLKIAFVGDGNNVAHSLMFAGAQLGAQMWIASPPGYEPKHEAMEWAFERALHTGGSLTVTNNPLEAAFGADVIYTDVWTSMGQESETDARKKTFVPFQVNRELFSRAKDDCIFLHCLPAHRGEEVTAEIIDGPNSLVFQQAENRLHAQKAILHEVMKDVPVGGLPTIEHEAVHA
jgi:ornithine carbamoyltransferase